MDLFTLDSTFRKDELIDNFESLIWTERFASIGDFELHISSSTYVRNTLLLGTRVAINKSDRVMTIESIEEDTNDDGVKILIAKGRSMEAVMEDRAAVYSMASDATVKYYLYGIPGDICRVLFYSQCLTGVATPQDVLPYLAAANYARDPLESLSVQNWLVEPASLLEAIKKICDVFDLGFKLVLPPDGSLLEFHIYGGANRTSTQSVFDTLTFSSDLNNIQNTKSLRSNQTIKNVAYLTSSALNRIIYAPGVDPNVSGFQRKVVTINLGDKGDPPSAGPYPQRPAEPNYGTADQDPEPNYGIADQDPEPFYGVADQDPEPYYPPYDPPIEPDYGTPPNDPDGRTAWEIRHDALWRQYQIDRYNAYNYWTQMLQDMRNNWIWNNQQKYNTWDAARNAARNAWIASNDQKMADWVAARDAAKAAWIASNEQKYNDWYNNMVAERQAWLDDYANAVAAWQTETDRLYNNWITEIYDDMTQKAAEELGKYKSINSFDGEIDQHTGLRYGVDYNLGDLAELRNDDGMQFVRRITEQIFVSDKEGERAYPTLSELVQTP